ncbi:MAG: hypothetical protein ACI9GE_000917 [Oceanospirillaceae bacterium]|jgi:hypothetical protein
MAPSETHQKAILKFKRKLIPTQKNTPLKLAQVRLNVIGVWLYRLEELLITLAAPQTHKRVV